MNAPKIYMKLPFVSAGKAFGNVFIGRRVPLRNKKAPGRVLLLKVLKSRA